MPIQVKCTVRQTCTDKPKLGGEFKRSGRWRKIAEESVVLLLDDRRFQRPRYQTANARLQVGDAAGLGADHGLLAGR